MLPRMQYRPYINLGLRMPALLTLYPRSALKVRVNSWHMPSTLQKFRGTGEKICEPPLRAVCSFFTAHLLREYTNTHGDKRTGILNLHFLNSNGIMGITDSTYVILPMHL